MLVSLMGHELARPTNNASIGLASVEENADHLCLYWFQICSTSMLLRLSSEYGVEVVGLVFVDGTSSKLSSVLT